MFTSQDALDTGEQLPNKQNKQKSEYNNVGPVTGLLLFLIINLFI